MFLRITRCFFQEKFVARFPSSTIHPLQSNRQFARLLIQAHRVEAFCVAISALLLTCNPAVLSASGARRTGGGGTATLALSTTSLMFGDVPLNTAATQLVKLDSTGSASLLVDAASISGPGFAISGVTFPLRLSPNQSVTLAVLFDPKTAGAASGSLTLTSNSSSGKSTVIPFSGVGESAGVSTLNVSASAITFGDVNLNSPSTQSLTLTSTGSAVVTVSSATVSGTGFSVSGASFPLALAPNQTVVLSVQFDPTTAGAVSGTLTLTSSSSTGDTNAISLTGTGASSAYQVNLAWDAPAGSSDPVAGYNVYRAGNGSASYELLNTSPVTQTTYADSTVAINQTYNYYVESVDASGDTSAPSNTASINVP
jgi:hypothetical protein